MLLARELLARTVAALRFMPCPVCGNHQPFEVGRGVPDCESCGHVFAQKDLPDGR